MGQSYRKVRVFLASPGDIVEERKITREVIDEINRTIAEERGVVLHVFGWESDTYPSYGSDAQDIINQQSGSMDRYDLFVGIMGDRFGTETPRAGSGTEEEFVRAVEGHETSGRPDIMLYFRQSPVLFTTEEQLTQRMKVLAFRKRVQANGLTSDYRNCEEFRRAVHGHLVRWLMDFTKRAPLPLLEGTPAAGAPAEPRLPHERGSVSESGTWVLLSTGFYLADSVSERADGTVVMSLESKTPHDEAGLRSLRPDRHGRGERVPYAYQDDACLARVKAAERESKGGCSLWIVTLAPERDRGSRFLAETAFNGVSADEIAAMRARLILLGELPTSGGGVDDQILLSLVQGHPPGIRIAASPFPELWLRFRDQPEVFLPLARLQAIFLLKVSGTCDHVLDLTLGPIRQNRLEARFHGRRRKQYINAAAPEINVAGRCPLLP